MPVECFFFYVGIGVPLALPSWTHITPPLTPLPPGTAPLLHTIPSTRFLSQLAIVVNPDSGDQRGVRILDWFRCRYPRVVCIDLSMPATRAPSDIARLRRLGRVIVAGGDGTLALALARLERLVGRGNVGTSACSCVRAIHAYCVGARWVCCA